MTNKTKEKAGQNVFIRRTCPQGNHPVGVYSLAGNKIIKENKEMKADLENLQNQETSTKNTAMGIDSLREALKEGSIKEWADEINDCIRTGAEEGHLTEDNCRMMILLTTDLAERDDFNNEDEKYLIRMEVSLAEDIPLYRCALALNALVFQMQREEPDESLVRDILAFLREMGYSYKRIKRSMNKTLKLEDKKRFGKLLSEIKDEVETFLAWHNQTDQAAEKLSSLGNEPWTEEKALTKAIEGMSSATEALLRDGSLGSFVFLEKEDGTLTFPLVSNSDREKAQSLQALQRLVDKTNPDAVRVFAETWVGGNESELKPSEDPERKEAIMVSVETPLGIWGGLQYFSREENGKIVLDELIGPEKADPQGRLVFMDHEEERVQCNA